MSAKNDPFKETISAYLESVAKNDKLFAITLKKPNKNIDSCIKYIYSEVKKTGRCGFNDDEIFQMAIHYYDEDGIKDDTSVSQNRPLVTHTPERPLKNTTVKQSNRKNKKKAVTQAIQGSLFD